MNDSLSASIHELQRMFNYFNQQIYNGELKKPVFIIASRRNAYGWCSTGKVWSVDQEKNYEVGITAEFLNRPYEEIAETIMHEMVHLYNLQNGVKDCSNNVHNKKFKAEAERRHLKVEKMGRYGWAHTSLTDVSKEIIGSFDRDESVFNLFRLTPEKPQKEKQKPFHYFCPKCGAKVTSKEEIQATCKKCAVDFITKEAI